MDGLVPKLLLGNAIFAKLRFARKSVPLRFGRSLPLDSKQSFEKLGSQTGDWEPGPWSRIRFDSLGNSIPYQGSPFEPDCTVPPVFLKPVTSSHKPPRL